MIYQILTRKSVLITVTCLHSEIDTSNVSHNDKRLIMKQFNSKKKEQFHEGRHCHSIKYDKNMHYLKHLTLLPSTEV